MKPISLKSQPSTLRLPVKVSQAETIRKLDVGEATECFLDIDWAAPPEFSPKPITLKAGIPKEIWRLVMAYARLALRSYKPDGET